MGNNKVLGGSATVWEEDAEPITRVLVTGIIIRIITVMITITSVEHGGCGAIDPMYTLTSFIGHAYKRNRVFIACPPYIARVMLIFLHALSATVCLGV